MFAKPLFWILLSGVLLLAAGCVTESGHEARPRLAGARDSAGLSRAEIEARILQELDDLGENELARLEGQSQGAVSGDFPITINERVEFFIEYYQTKMPARFTRYLNRSGRYYTVMRDILKEYGLPPDLFYIALIESGFTNTAASHAGAVGPWQFMPATARRFGLRVDNWVDERRDPIKATHAAAQYLEFLYGEFGSWYLAAAAYNAGENKIRKALTLYQARDFWNISQNDQDFLAEETKQYVPRMIAAAIIAKEPEKYGFDEVEYEAPLQYEEMSIHPTTSLAAIAKAAGISSSVLLDLNPELKLAASPPGGMYPLKIPHGSLSRMTQAYAGLTPEQRTARISERAAASYRVRSGDTLSTIARRYRITVAQLYALNPELNNKPNLRIGQDLRLPGAAAPAAAAASARAVGAYKVASGDTLGVIARRHHTTIAQIYALNPALNNKPNLRIGQTLQLPGAAAPAAPVAAARAAATYKVASGDTLGAVARRHHTTIAQLYALNPELNNKPNLRTGQTLRLPGAAAPAAPAAPVASARAAGTYKVASGDTLGTIARRHHTTIAQIYALNPALNNKPDLRIGQTLQLPGAAAVASAPQSAAAVAAPVLISGNTRTVVHTVQRGDTLHSVARSYNLSIPQIKEQLGRETLYSGEKVTLRVPANQAEGRAQAPPASRAARQEAAQYYTVQKGDTLWAVSSRFKVSVADIKRMNNLNSDRLTVGRRLQIR
jgi:membrane-bound lytic murein transglycosylase D